MGETTEKSAPAQGSFVLPTEKSTTDTAEKSAAAQAPWADSTSGTESVEEAEETTEESYEPNEESTAASEKSAPVPDRHSSDSAGSLDTISSMGSVPDQWNPDIPRDDPKKLKRLRSDSFPG